MDRQTLRRRRVIQALVGLCIAVLMLLVRLPLIGLLCIAATLISLRRRQGVPVLVYHSVSSDASWLPWATNISVRPEVFVLHMTTLARAGWTVVTDRDLFAALQMPGALPRRSVVLHFDDAYADILANAVPVLRDHKFPASIFASTDFIDKSEGLRTGHDTAPKGYINADELRHLDADPLFEIASHGKDHSRIATGDTSASRAQVHDWDVDAAYLWSHMSGDKSKWFEARPPAISQLPDNDSALTAQAPNETPEQQAVRVTALLSDARTELSAVLGREVRYLCWPFDRVTPEARQAAFAAGFKELTGGRTDNWIGSKAPDISRTHVNDHAAGPAPLWVEGLVFRAKLEVASGNLLWFPISALAALRRKKYMRFLHGDVT